MDLNASVAGRTIYVDHVNEYPFSAEESEDDELPWEKNQWCALPDASYHHNVCPVLLQYMGTTSTVSLSATCMFAICIAPVIRKLIDESKRYPNPSASRDWISLS